MTHPMNASTSFLLRRAPRPRQEQSPSALGPALEVIRGLDKLPSCFLAQLLATPLQVPSESRNGGTIEIPLPASGWLPLFSTPEKLMTSQKGASPQTAATIFIGDILASLPLPERFAGLILDPGSSGEFRLPANSMSQLQEIQSAVEVLSGNRLPHSESEEIASGTEMMIASPVPEPSPEFVSLLSRELSSRKDLEAAYLFDLVQENDESRLTIGLVPAAKTASDFPTFPDRLLETLGSHLTAVDELDLLILEDPELIEIVDSTVPSLIRKKAV